MKRLKAQEDELKRKIADRKASLYKLRGNLSSLNPLPPPSQADFQVMASSSPTSNPSKPSSTSVQFQSISSRPDSLVLSEKPSGQQSSIPIGLSSLIGSSSIGHMSNPPTQQQPQSLADICRQQEQRTSELFLRPSRSSDTGQGKPLRIVDFVSQLCPVEEEKIISTDSGLSTKLMLATGHNKMKLEHVTSEHFNIANLRIFYELLTSNKLPTTTDLRDYLYRSFDSSHLHEVMLIPKWAVGPGYRKPNNLGFAASLHDAPAGHGSCQSTDSAPPVVSHTTGGQEICQNFNRLRGCQESACKFVHACNCKVAGRACGKPHSGSTHNQSDQ